MGDARSGAENRQEITEEETVRKSLILVATAIGGGVGYAAGVTEVATGTGADDPSTWRWQVSSILAAQNDKGAQRVETVADAFNQRYERYTQSGLPRQRGDAR
jgi:hypothetical protein